MPLLKPYPVIHTMRSIEAMRDDAAKWIDRKNKAHAEGKDTRVERETLYQAESMIAYAIAARALCPPCPFCAGGVFGPTGTEGRLGCVDCGALALRAGYRTIVHVGADPVLDLGDEGDAEPTKA